ncbi:MAG: FeoB-associated Cys-rich membrane protein [Oscillospiraceae bacterium]|nr:FeoB-associated Cys-rich membrane protein [Oscillospiraceae bacterium]
MLDFISQNLGSIIIGLAVLGVITLIIVKMVKERKSGKSVGCGCGCESCHGCSHK